MILDILAMGAVSVILLAVLVVEIKYDWEWRNKGGNKCGYGTKNRSKNS